MRVFYSHYEYDLYIDETGRWKMHTFDNSREEGDRWVETDSNASESNPFASTVIYDAWR